MKGRCHATTDVFLGFIPHQKFHVSEGQIEREREREIPLQIVVRLHVQHIEYRKSGYGSKLDHRFYHFGYPFFTHCHLPFSRRLGADQPILGLRMLSAELSNEDYQSIEMAAKELDRTGTLALGGFSFPVRRRCLLVSSFFFFPVFFCFFLLRLRGWLAGKEARTAEKGPTKCWGAKEK